MSGEHILKLLIEENTRISLGDRWLVVRGLPIEYYVYERKPYQKKACVLIETKDEQEACKILKGE